jgi:hypothetical protein
MTATIATLGGFSTVQGYGGDNKDPNGTNQIASGGQSSALNLTAAQAIKASPGRIYKAVILGVVGTGGSLTFNDCTTTGGATTANQIYTTAGTIAVGTVVTLDFPCANGITCSAVPTGGTVQIAISFN